MSCFFVICFLLYFFKLSAGHNLLVGKCNFSFYCVSISFSGFQTTDGSFIPDKLPDVCNKSGATVWNEEQHTMRKKLAMSCHTWRRDVQPIEHAERSITRGQRVGTSRSDAIVYGDLYISCKIISFHCYVMGHLILLKFKIALLVIHGK